MRASRLLQLLLLLQNRGRMTCAGLARELEVTRRTILRDVDALTEAGLPVVVIRGNQGGIELGFNYRTRLTGLASDEAEALAVLLSSHSDQLHELGMRSAAERAAAKLMESLPDTVREKVMTARIRFRIERADVVRKSPDKDPRLEALAKAVRERRIVYIEATSARRRKIQPTALVCGTGGWSVADQSEPDVPIPLASCGDINVSAMKF